MSSFTQMMMLLLKYDMEYLRLTLSLLSQRKIKMCFEHEKTKECDLPVNT